MRHRILGFAILIWVLSMIANRVLALSNTEPIEINVIQSHEVDKERHFTITPEQWKR